MKKNGKPDSISPELLKLLQNAQSNLQSAQGIQQFTLENIARQYGLKDGDTVDAQTGAITYGPKIEAGGKLDRHRSGE